jgi:hypothetical protein
MKAGIQKGITIVLLRRKTAFVLSRIRNGPYFAHTRKRVHVLQELLPFIFRAGG